MAQQGTLVVSECLDIIITVFFPTNPTMITMMMVKKAIFDFAPNFLVHQGMEDDDCA